MPPKLAAFAAVVCISLPALALDTDYYGFEGQAGVFGSRPTLGVGFSGHVLFSTSELTLLESARIHGGPYGIRVDNDVAIGKLVPVGNGFIEPFLGLNFSLNSITGLPVWVVPGLLFLFPVADRRLTFNAGALIGILGGGVGAALEARLYPSKDGLYFGVVTQLVSPGLLLLGAVGVLF